MSSYTRQQFESWLKQIDVDCDRVLDIGGSQLSIKDRVKSWKVNDYKILDLEVPHECKQKPDIICDLNESIPCEDKKNGLEYTATMPIEKSDKSYENYFDVAFLGEVSEYFWNPVQAFKNINYFLKPGGILYLSSHFIYPVHWPLVDDCLRYTRQGITKILEKTGFEVLELKQRGTTGMNMVQFYLDQGMRPGKTYKYHSEVGHLIRARKL